MMLCARGGVAPDALINAMKATTHGAAEKEILTRAIAGTSTRTLTRLANEERLSARQLAQVLRSAEPVIGENETIWINAMARRPDQAD